MAQSCSPSTAHVRGAFVLALTCVGCAQTNTEVFDEKQRSEHDFFQYVAKSYKFFLAGDDYQSQAVDDEISQEAENRAEQIKARNHQLQQVTFQSLTWKSARA